MTESIVILSILSSSLGSFLNVCAIRIPKGISVVGVRSHCPQCHCALRWYELIPVASYVMLRGRCRTCRRTISCRYPVYELFTAAVTCFLYLKSGFSGEFLWEWTFVMVMSVIATTDWEGLLIPNKVLFVSLVIGLALVGLLYPADLPQRTIEATIAALITWLIRFTGNLLLKRESMGIGDVKLSFVVGLFLGLELFIVTLWLAALLGLVFVLLVQLSLFARKNHPFNHPGRAVTDLLVPFGAFLALSSSTVLVFHEAFENLLARWLILIK